MTREDPTRYAAAAARLLRELHTESPPCLSTDQARVTDAVAQALAARGRRRTRFAVVFGTAAAAALVIAGAVVTRRDPIAHGPATASAPDQRALVWLGEVDRRAPAAPAATALTPGMALPGGIRLGAPADGEVQLGTAAGTTLTLERAASLTVTQASTTLRFALHGGAVRVRVAPLLAGERFVIDTRDAEIEVHGTAFRVAIVGADARCADADRTAVTVTEGVVAVRSRGDEARLLAGGTWLSSCATPADTARATAPETAPPPAPRHHPPVSAIARRATAWPVKATAIAASAPVTPPAPAVPPAAPRTIAEPAPTASVLAAQNNLFAAAVRAKNQGRARDAAALFERLVTDYPRGPLAESAAAQRMKVLASAGDAADARQVARDYLARYPAGFARAQAQRLLEQPAP